MTSFFKNTKHDNFIQNMTNYFDENIAMYNIIDKYKIANEMSAHVDASAMVYIVKPDSDCDVVRLIETLSNMTITLYQYQYNIDISETIDNSLRITLINKTSR